MANLKSSLWANVDHWCQMSRIDIREYRRGN